MDRSKKIAVIKTILKTVAVVGAGIITTSAVANNTPDDLSLPKKAVAAVGGMVIGMIVKDAVAQKVDNLVDAVVATIDKHSQKN